MGFVDFRTIRRRETLAEEQKTPVSEIDKILQTAEQQGVPLERPKRKRGFLGGIQKFAEILSTGEFAVGGLLAGKGIRAGIREKISPSDVLLGIERPDTKVGRFIRGAIGLAVDIAFDPTTYLTLGVGSAIKVTTKTGVKIALSKSGKEMLKDLALDVGEKRARSVIAKRALASPELRAKAGLKFAGFQVLSESTLKKPFRATLKIVSASRSGRKLLSELERVGNAVGKTFSRDYGLDSVARENKQLLLDGLNKARLEIKENLAVVFGGLNKAQRTAISFAIEGKEQAIAKLSAGEQKVARRVKKVFQQLHKEEEKRGLLNSWIPDYITHAYRNRTMAKTLLGTMRDGKPSGLLKFAKERRIPTLREAEKLGLEPVTDIAEIMNIRLMASEKAILTQNFLVKTAETKGLRIGEITSISKVSKELEPLAQEARKFKSAEEFVKSQTKVFHGTSKESAALISKEGFKVGEKIGIPTEFQPIDKALFGDVVFFTDTPRRAKVFAGTSLRISEKNIEVIEITTSNLKLAKPSDAIGGTLRADDAKGFRAKIKDLESRGFDGLQRGKQEIIVWNIDKIKTKSQLTDFFNQAKQVEIIPTKIPKNILELKEGFGRLGEFAVGVPKSIRDVLIPRNIGEDIAKMEKRFLNDPDLNILLKGYDKALNFFKLSVTVLFPAFHGRNAISNVAQGFLDIGVQAFNPVKHKKAVDIMLNRKGSITTDIGTTLSYKEVRELAKTHGVLQNRITRIDVDTLLTEKVFRRTTPAEIGRRLGIAIEGEARMVLFLRNLERGFEPADAAKRVKDFLFDYDNLSGFERDVMRRFIPFYTWTRKNIALQLKALSTQPGKPLAQFKALQSIEDMFGEPKTEEEKKFSPDFVIAGMNVLLARQGDDRTFLSGFDLPIESAFDFFNKPLKEVMSSFTPILKAPLEKVTGFNFFKEKQIKTDDSGRSFEVYPQFMKDWLEFTEREFTTKEGKLVKFSKVNPEKKWWINQIETFMGIGRLTSQSTLEPLTTAWKMTTGQEITLVDKANMVRFFTGLRAFTIDIEASKRAIEKNDLRALEDILIREGILGRFERTFVPKKEEQTEQEKTAPILNRFR